MKKRRILTFVIALLAALSMMMAGKVNNVEAKSSTYWYYSYLNANKPLKESYYLKWGKSTLKVNSTFVKVKTTSYRTAKSYLKAHPNKYKLYKKTFKISPKVKLQLYETTGDDVGKFYKGKKSEMKTWETQRFSFQVRNGIVTAICVDVSEYLGE